MQTNLRTANTSNPIIRDSQPTGPGQVANLGNGTTVQLAETTSPPPAVRTERAPDHVADPDTPPDRPLDSQNLRQSTTDDGPPALATGTVGGTGATGNMAATGGVQGTGAVADTGQAERTSAARALHQETADALSFLLGDLPGHLKKADKVHIPDANAQTGGFDPTNGAHTDAAKAVLERLIKEHTGPFGHKDGVAKAAERVLEALGNALSSLEGTGVYDFRPANPAPAPVIADGPPRPEDAQDAPAPDQSGPHALSGAVQNLRNELDADQTDIWSARRGTTGDDGPKLRRQDASRDLRAPAPGLSVGDQAQSSVGDVLNRELAALKDELSSQPEDGSRPKLVRREAMRDIPRLEPHPDGQSPTSGTAVKENSSALRDDLVVPDPTLDPSTVTFPQLPDVPANAKPLEKPT